MTMIKSRVKAQPKAIAAYLEIYDGLENSWCDERKDYLAWPNLAEWYNGRETGYVIYMKSRDYNRQINIAFFEHRCGDHICVVVWEQNTGLNPPNVETAKFPEAYEENGEPTISFKYGMAEAAASWIYNELEEFWDE